MTGRMGLLAFVAASGAVHSLGKMPSRPALIAILLACIFVCLVLGTAVTVRWRWRAATILLCAAAGFVTTVLRIDQRLTDALAEDNIDKVSRVVLRVASLPKLGPDSRQFEAQVLSSIPDGVPSRIQVSWAAPNWGGPYGRTGVRQHAFPDIVPGQVWRMALTLKPPNGLRNLHAFDYEGYAFAHGIRASGSVRGVPRLLGDEPWASLPVVAQRARHAVRAAMQPFLDGKRYGAVLLALAISDQASVAAVDWEIFNRSGITHLVSISGSHITMIAAMGGALTLWLWRRLRIGSRALAERIPAQLAAALVALVVAWLYCLLAGWGVPARRTFLMLAVVAAAYLVRIPIGPSRLLTLVAFAVVVLDPWALLASGFWLSFAAVYILMASGSWQGRAVHGGMRSRRQRLGAAALMASRLQLALTVGLMPFLALLFHEVSLASPLVNAYAIPVISLIVTPLSLLCAAAAMVPGLAWLADLFAWLGHAALHASMVPTVWLAQLPLSSFHAAAAPTALTMLALAGVIVAASPYGLPGRRAAWLLMAPALFWTPKRPAEGEWTLHALDVGQASAIVIQTARHALLFDTGLRSGPASDTGSRVIRPFLRAQGIRRLDALVVSHADIDHAGGARSVLQSLPIEQSYSSFGLHAYLERESAMLGGLPPPALPLARSSCHYGMTWQIDGVSFSFLWPLDDTSGRRIQRKQRNEHACVLYVQGRHHSALLPGDIGARQEAALVERGLEAVDVVLAAHHGSKSSSGQVFVDHMQARHVIVQAGRWNRYGHPNAAVEQRWQDSGALVWRTDRHGAVQVHSREGALDVEAVRLSSRRYWQTP